MEDIIKITTDDITQQDQRSLLHLGIDFRWATVHFYIGLRDIHPPTRNQSRFLSYVHIFKVSDQHIHFQQIYIDLL